MNDNNAQNQINIELDEKIAEGIYSKVKSRIVLTPQHAKRLLKALAENIQRFEQAHGEIKEGDAPQIPLNFGPTGQA
jgi:hypothetical protein